MKNESVVGLLNMLYTLGFIGILVAGALFAFLTSSGSNPDTTAQIILAILLAATILSFALAIVTRVALRLFIDHICNQAFIEWDSNLTLGDKIHAEMLAELAELSPDQVWLAREFLERKAKKVGIHSAQAARPNRRPYRFPRAQK